MKLCLNLILIMNVLIYFGKNLIWLKVILQRVKYRMTGSIDKKQWEYYLDPNNKDTKMCRMMNSIESAGYCLNPNCPCSNALMWLDRKSSRYEWQAHPGMQQEIFYDDLPDSIKLDLRMEWLKICQSTRKNKAK